MSATHLNFKAAVLVETGKPLRFLDDIKAPALQKGQVLVKLKFAGLCHSQLMEAQGARGKDNYLPHFLGHEGSGIVVSTGDGVTKVKATDEVVVGWIRGDGLEGGPKTYDSASVGKINAGAVTTFSQFTVVSENRVYLKPKSTPFDLAVLYGCALPTGAGLVMNEMRPCENASIAVIGIGGIGLSALIALKQFNPKHLIAIDSEDHKLSLAKELGATTVINMADKDIKEKLYAKVGPEGFDYAVEAAGKTSTIEFGFEIVKRNGGQLIFASHPPTGEKIRIDPFELICGKSIRGSWGGASKPDQDIALLGQIYETGRLPLESLLSHQYNLEDINEAMSALENRSIVRALINLWN